MFQWGIIGTIVGSVLVIVGSIIYLSLRFSFIRLAHIRYQRGIEKLLKLLSRYQSFKEVDAKASSIKRSYSPEIIEKALKKWIGEFPENKQTDLKRLYATLGIVKYYLEILKKDHRWIRRTDAATQLGNMGLPEAIDPLLERLKDPKEDERNVKRACGEALSKIQDPRVIPTLIEAMRVSSSWTAKWLEGAVARFGDHALPYLFPLLGPTEEKEVRISVAKQLGYIGNHQATLPLLEGIDDPDEDVRSAFVSALGELNDSSVVGNFIKLMTEDPSPEVRRTAAGALGRIGSEHALEALVRALNQVQPLVRFRAIECLEKFGSKAEKHILPLLDDPDYNIQVAAALTIDRLGGTDSYIEQLESGDVEGRREAEKRLIQIGKAGSLQSIVAATQHGGVKSRSTLCQVLGKIGGEGVVDPLLNCCEDSDWSVRAEALEALKGNSSESGYDAILKALSDEEETIREIALSALDEIPKEYLDKRADEIAMLLNDSNREIRFNTLNALARMNTDISMNAVLSQIKSGASEIRSRVITLLALEGKIFPTSDMILYLADPSDEVRQSTLKALGERRDSTSINSIIADLGKFDEQLISLSSSIIHKIKPESEEVVKHLVGLKNPKGKRVAARYIGLSKMQKQVPTLVLWVGAKEPEVRAESIWAMSQFEGPKSKEILRRHVEDKDTRVRAAAVRGLAKLKDIDSQHLIVKALRDESEGVRREACIAIGRLNALSAIPLLDNIARKGPVPERAFACVGLGLMSDKKAQQAALSLLSSAQLWSDAGAIIRDESEKVKYEFLHNLDLDPALFQLAEETKETEEIFNKYVRMFKISDPKKRIQAVRAIVALHKVSDVEEHFFAMVRGDPVPEIRIASLSALESQGTPKMFRESLKIALKDTSQTVLLNALQYLKDITSGEAESQLLDILISENEDVLKEASRVLFLHLKQDGEKLLQLLRKTENMPRACGLIRAMGKINDKVFLPELLSLLKGSPVIEIRSAAAHAVGDMKESSAVNVLKEAVSDNSEKVRAAVIEALGSIGGKESGFIIAKACDDRDSEVRTAVCRAFRRIPPEQIDNKVFENVMIKLLEKDQDPSVRVQAAFSMILREIDDKTLFKDLENLTKNYTSLVESLVEEEHVAERLHTKFLTGKDPKKRQYALKVMSFMPAKVFQDDFHAALKDEDEDIREFAQTKLRKRKYAA
ncbi:HEAT repeat domain-containing protein [Bdellovibrionota bacterium]